MRNLPPLNTLKAFEAVARLGSLTKAAKELHVTHGALSRQVNQLEQWVGRPLFIRTLASQLVLTDVGRRYAQELAVLLDGLNAASAAAREHLDGVLTVKAAPTFMMHWLIPRLSSFQRRHPEITIKLATDSKPAELGDGDSDIAIHNLQGRQQRISCMPFMNDCYLPICHADLLEQVVRPGVDWLTSQTLISYSSWPNSWQWWLTGEGLSDLKVKHMQLEQMFFAMQAAMEGLGVAILPLAVVLDNLVQGQLAAPLGLRGVLHKPWLACYRQAHSSDPLVSNFLQWLRSEAHDFEATTGIWIRSQTHDSNVSE